ncbi:hypothetical protein MJT46_006032 [Ovis ammon polii x Ovis aries]|nr:hypothetical protein MJT46_006032 [Ovis ammon polii x Ovis aries]
MRLLKASVFSIFYELKGKWQGCFEYWLSEEFLLFWTLTSGSEPGVEGKMADKHWWTVCGEQSYGELRCNAKTIHQFEQFSPKLTKWTAQVRYQKQYIFYETKEDGIDISVLGFHGPSPTWKLVSGNLKGSGQKWSNNPEVTLSLVMATGVGKTTSVSSSDQMVHTEHPFKCSIGNTGLFSKLFPMTA